MCTRTPRIGLVCLAFVLPASAWAADFDPWTEPARYQFSYQVDLSQIDAEPGDSLRLWLPTPDESADQRVISRETRSPVATSEATDDLGNRMLHAAWQGPAAPGEQIELLFTVERRPSTGTPRESVGSASADDPRRFLRATKRVPLDGLIAQLGEQESRGLASDAEKIRAFYDYVVKNMRYAKHGEGWGEGDAIWACTERYGNCTDFHSLFLGMARSQGIPARFVIGFPITPTATSAEVGGYHCWAEAWDAERGWLPLDASEAWKAKRFDDFFGALPSDRIAFTTGRDLTLAPRQQGAPLNYFVYPYVERNGEAVEGVKGHYRFQRIAQEDARNDLP